jgi:DNA-binding NarL/FixJ family response regulator
MELLRGAERSGESAFSILTSRELEILQSITEGKSTKEIAADLSLSVKTVETHRTQIMDKLDLHSIAELTKYAIREEITEA